MSNSVFSNRCWPAMLTDYMLNVFEIDPLTVRLNFATFGIDPEAKGSAHKDPNDEIALR